MITFYAFILISLLICDELIFELVLVHFVQVFRDYENYDFLC